MPLLLSLIQIAAAQSAVPNHQIPPSVLAELELLENRFDIALAVDCDRERCFSRGCTYVEHTVADQPRSRSLPGLGQESGPGSVPAQEYLTRARCSFAYEAAEEPADIQVLARRLQTKLSKGWTSVSVTSQPLKPLPRYLLDPPAADPALEPEPEAIDEVIEPPAPVPWSPSVAAHQLWGALLPHFFWMVGIGLITLAGTVLIWAWRRVGQASIEDQMLLAQLAGGELDEPEPEPEPSPVEHTDEADSAFVAEQDAAWTARLDAMDPASVDPEIRALVRELLRAGELGLLAKAVLRFPRTLPPAFPEGAEVAEAKLELSRFLTSAQPEDLPSDTAFFRALNRHALAAAVAAQHDTEIVRSLQEEYGAVGLANLIGRLPARHGALLFALAPSALQRQVVRSLQPQQVAEMCDMLLRSNRMDPAETAHLFAVLAAVRADQPLPTAHQPGNISDRGAEFDAAAVLSVLLESLDAPTRSALFDAALQRLHGVLPAWTRGILFSELLFAIPAESRADLLLEVDIHAVAAWLSLLGTDAQQRLLSGAPSSLVASIRASSVFSTPEQQLALAATGRRALANSFQRKLEGAGLSFEGVVGSGGA